MKKLLCMILTFLLVVCSMSAVITSYAEDSENLLADATHANGKVTWTTEYNEAKKEGSADAWGSSYQDNKTNSVNGGYSWTFGMGDGRVGGNTNNATDPSATPWPLYNFEEYKDVYAYVYVKVDGLKIGEKYEFSYYYQNDYIMEIASIKTSGGDFANFSTPVTENGSKARSYKVTTVFTAPVNGDYVIAIRTNRYNRTPDCAWSNVILSDLSLTKTEGPFNILKNATSAAGDVTWTANADAWGSYQGAPTQDSTSRSVNGGYSWTFGMGNTSVGLPTNANPAYVYIKAKGLAAGSRYDFSFIYQGDYNVVLDSIADSSNAKVEPEVAAKDVAISGGNNARQVVTTFLAPTDGNYTITLRTSRDMHISGHGWDNVILSDLVLAENTEPKKVTAGVLVSGNGSATVSDQLPAIGSEVTFSAVPYPEEEFLGWYNGDEKVGDQTELKVVISDSITLTAKFTSNSLNVLAGKKASDWEGYHWTKIEDSNESRNGGHGYLVSDIMWQSMYTKVTLTPNTEYSFSFNWKSVVNSVCPGYPVEVMVYSANEVDINDRYNNWSDNGESGMFKPKSGTDLEKGNGYSTEEMAKSYQWQNLATSFTTTNDTEYYIIIYFSINGGANHQAINLSDFILKSIEKEVPSISEKDASEWSCYQWSKIENSNVSRYGGKAYLVKDAMYQNIYTTLTLKPNTKYDLSFEWKSVANNVGGPAFPNEVYVVSKKDIDVDDRSNWSDSDFKGGAYDLEQGGVINNGELAATLEWQNTTVSFTTKDDTEYTLLIHFQAGGNGHQEIYVSDFKLEEKGEAGPDDDDDDDDVVNTDNMASNYTNANGHVTWSDLADAWGSSFQDNKANSVYGGFAWCFGLANSHYENAPAYVTIKTDKLEANRKYEFSYIYQKDFIMVFDSIDPSVEIVKTEDVKLLEGDRAHRITIQFTTTKESELNIKLKMGKFMNNEGCNWSHVVLSDLVLCDITDRIYGKVNTELGGTIAGFEGTYCTRGDQITLTATPRSGNTFSGWFDAEGNKVSSDAVYTFTANADFDLLAKFSGNNIPNADWLEQHGMDGTFENGTMTGWAAEDREWGDDTSWALFERTNEVKYNGDYSLKMRSRYRTTFFNFTELKKSTTYHLSFNIIHPDLYIRKLNDEQEKSEYNEEALIKWFGITSGGSQLYSDIGAYPIKAGGGWYRVNIYFTTGDYTEAEWNFYYTNKDGAKEEFIYMDDVSLVEYTSNEFANGDFEDGAAYWRGDFVEENGVGKGKSFYQNIKVGEQTNNTVTFKAKGKGLGGASEIIAKDFNCENYVSSQSVVKIDSDDWKTYTFDVYSGVNTDVSLFFEASEGELLVDDVTVTKHSDRDGAIVEKIDFESDRFAFKVESDVFEIYNGTAGDPNVHSGSKSLKFNAAKAAEGVSYVLQDAFLSYQVVPKLNYKLTIYYKTAKGNDILLSPEFLPDEDIKALYSVESNGWSKVDFIFSKMSVASMKVIIGNIAGKTNADFYVDDITLAIAPPMVLETNSTNKYCEWPLNILNNQGFEEKITNNDWVSLPKNAEVLSDGGAAGDKYLRIKAGTKYIVPVKIASSDNYYFSISTRLGKNSAGTVAVATNPEGTKFYCDERGIAASVIKVDTSKWNRDSFLFSTGEAETIYLVFEATKGYIDIDEVHFYKRQYGKETDPNDHNKFVPYNYDNPDPSTVVLNGGDPTFSGKEEYLGEASPETGDTRTAPATILVITTLAVITLILTAKRNRKISKGGNA